MESADRILELADILSSLPKEKKECLKSHLKTTTILHNPDAVARDIIDEVNKTGGA